MARVSEVKHALKQGDRAKAAQLLKETLQKNPSAEAWYLAAKISNNPDKQKRHLQRALAMDSNHTKSRDMLRGLGGGVPTNAGVNFMTPILHIFEDIGKNSRLLGDMDPHRRGAVVLSGLICVALVLLVLVTVLFSGGDDQPVILAAEPLPENLESQVFVDHFTSGGLTIPQFQQVMLSDEDRTIQAEMDNGLGEIVTRTFNIVDKYQFTVMDASGANDIEVIFYRSFFEASLHQVALRNQDDTIAVESINNSVLVYPLSLDPGVAQTLIQIYKSTPPPAVSA